MAGPGAGLMTSLSCCPRAQVRGGCCAGLAWDVRSTILHSPVTVHEDNNVFCYNGPALAKIKASHSHKSSIWCSGVLLHSGKSVP